MLGTGGAVDHDPSGGSAASWQDWPQRSGALPHHSRADDAQKGQNGSSIRVFGACLLRRLHGRTVTDGLFQEKVTAQQSAADA